MATGTIQLPVGAAVGDATYPPGRSLENNVRKLLFDGTAGASAGERCYWTFRLPGDYASALTAKIQYQFVTVTTGNWVCNVYVYAYTPGTDTGNADADSYDTKNSGTLAAGTTTAGQISEGSITLTNADSAAAGDWITVKLERDANDASDTITEDVEVSTFTLTYTTT